MEEHGNTKGTYHLHGNNGNSNGSRRSVQEASENMGRDSRRCNFILFLVC